MNIRILLIPLLFISPMLFSYVELSFSLHFDGNKLTYDCNLNPDTRRCSSEAGKKFLIFAVSTTDSVIKEILRRNNFTSEKEQQRFNDLRKRFENNAEKGKSIAEYEKNFDKLLEKYDVSVRKK